MDSGMVDHDLELNAPPMRWDEGLPLGCGLLGALVWGDGMPLNVSIDRADLWDRRPVPEFQTPEYNFRTLCEWIRTGRSHDLEKFYRQTYLKNPAPTKIPAGRIVLDLCDRPRFEKARLRLVDATVNVSFNDGPEARVFVHATERVGLIRLRGMPAGFIPRLVTPPFAGGRYESEGEEGMGNLAGLGYPAPAKYEGTDWVGYVQDGWNAFRFSVALAWKQTDSAWEGVWCIATSRESDDVLSHARNQATRALATGFDAMYVSHAGWWAAYWKHSSVRIPHAVLDRQWFLETYKFGAASRRGAPPIALQSPWTADDGRIPPWKGDYHHDLNTELSYWCYYSGNHLDEGCCFLDWLWDTKPTCEAWTRRFYGAPGLNVPGVADIANNPLGGGYQWSHSCTTAAWLAQHFYLHWRYSMDPVFLRERAWPYIRACATFIAAITELGPGGKRRLPLTSSPEMRDPRIDTLSSPITNYDLALIRWLLGATTELAEAMELKDEADHWRAVLDEMPDLSVAQNGRLLVAKDFALSDNQTDGTASHRHFSHLMAIHPLGLIRQENGPLDQRTIAASLAELDRLGTDAWVGFSYAWLVSLAARARDGAKAARAAEIFATAFCLKNSFHCNGDQSGKGYSNYTYRPFTLEANFAFAAGIQEMLLQSHGGVIVVFPAIPDDWRDVRFETLRAEGAFLVSAERQAGRTCCVTIVSERGGTLRLVDPFAGAPITLDVAGVTAQQHRGERYIMTCRPGARIEMRICGWKGGQ